MSFLFRTLFVVGLIYLLSPLRADLPDWLVSPSPEAAREVTPVLAQSAADAVISTCKTHEAACAEIAGQAVARAAQAAAPKSASHTQAQVATTDAQAAFEALVKQAAAMPAPTADEATPSIPALIEKPQAQKPKPAPATATADAPNALNLTTIPLPPRRKI